MENTYENNSETSRPNINVVRRTGSLPQYPVKQQQRWFMYQTVSAKKTVSLRKIMLFF